MRRVLLSFFALLFVLVGTFVAYQHWQVTSEKAFENDIVQLNSSIKINNISVENNKTLIPLGAIMGVNDVDHMDFQYIVNATFDQEIDIRLSNIILHNESGSHVFDSLLSSTYETADMGNHYKLVSIRVFMNEPKTYEEYEMIANSSISFNIDFNLS